MSDIEQLRAELAAANARIAEVDSERQKQIARAMNALAENAALRERITELEAEHERVLQGVKDCWKVDMKDAREQKERAEQAEARIDKALALANELPAALMVSAVSEHPGLIEVWNDADDRGPIALFRDADQADIFVELRAALAADTPTTATAEPPPDWIADLSQGIRDQMCVCGHTRDTHACTFASVQCICGCTEFRYGTASAEGSDQ